MGDKVKFNVWQVNDEEYLDPTEKDLKADIVELDPQINGYDDVQQFIAESNRSFQDDYIPSGIYLVIPVNRQYIVYNRLCIDEKVEVNGRLVIL